MKTLRDEGPCEVLSVNVKGKFMWWSMSFPNEKNWWLWTTYGMSGRWTTEPAKHIGFEIEYRSPRGSENEKLHFHDARHFGTLKFVSNISEMEKKLKTLGPDMMVPMTDAEFKAALNRKGGKTLAEALMDQSLVSGVGNYVKAESLYLAGLSPHRIVNSLTDVEFSLLRQQIFNVMTASFNGGGATISTYRETNGNKGTAQSRFVVYGNKVDPMGNPVIREETLDGRTTHWVPNVQL